MLLEQDGIRYENVKEKKVDNRILDIEDFGFTLFCFTDEEVMEGISFVNIKIDIANDHFKISTPVLRTPPPAGDSKIPRS